jgi:hypothetical protein
MKEEPKILCLHSRELKYVLWFLQSEEIHKYSVQCNTERRVNLFNTVSKYTFDKINRCKVTFILILKSLIGICLHISRTFTRVAQIKKFRICLLKRRECKSTEWKYTQSLRHRPLIPPTTLISRCQITSKTILWHLAILRDWLNIKLYISSWAVLQLSKQKY